MARSLLEARDARKTETVEQRESRISRLAAGSLAAAISVLVIASLVVGRSANLDPAGTSVGGGFESGTISLVDDDQGRMLFDLADMGPGRPVPHCLEVTYDGTILPVDLAMRAEATGDLAPFLDVVVEQGQGGGFRNCGAFTPTNTIYRGTLAQLAASGWLSLDRILNSGATRSYRITFELQDDQDALGRSASTSLVWEVTPS